MKSQAIEVDEGRKEQRNLNLKKVNKKRLIFAISSALLVIMGLLYYFVLSVPSLEKAKDSVIMVEVYDNENNLISTGSGFCAYKDNFIVTNFHVIEGGYSFKIIDDSNKKYEVNKIVIFNKKDDLAILQINGKLKKLRVNSKSKIRVKDPVIAIGSPKGELNTVSEGIISNIDDKNLIRISVPISHGSSGGVLLNKRNEVIGITSAGYDDAENLNFAIKAKKLASMYENYKTNFYDKITSSNYKSCAPNIVNYNTQTQLRIRNKCGFSGKNDYSVNSFDMFYKTTNSSEIFKTAMNKLEKSNEFRKKYMELSEQEQIKVADFYSELLEYEDCNIENLVDGCSIDNIDNWNTEEMIIELDAMPTYGLAIFEVAKDKYDSRGLYDYINSLPLKISQKGILLILYGDFSPSSLTNDNAKEIIEYINSKNLSTSDKEKILSYLGYTVNGNNIRW